MNNELSLWSLSWKKLSRHYSIESTTLFANLISLLLVIGLTASVSFVLGRQLREIDSGVWVRPYFALLVTSGLLAGSTPLVVRAALQLLPVPSIYFLWHKILNSFRYPLIIVLIGAGLYLGVHNNTYYSNSQQLYLILGFTGLSFALFTLGFALGDIIKQISHHILIRSTLILGVLAFLTQFFSSDQLIVPVFQRSFDSPSLSEILLIMLSAVGLAGVSVSLVELRLRPAGLNRQLLRYWDIFAHQRNYRVAYTQFEAGVIGEMLFLARNARLHQSLAILSLLYLILIPILLTGLGELPNGLKAMIFGLAIGLVAYHLSLDSGRRHWRFEAQNAQLPLKSGLRVGRAVASGVPMLIIGGLFGEYLLERTAPFLSTNLLAFVITALFVHSLAFTLGRRLANHGGEQADRYGVFIVTAATALALVGQLFSGNFSAFFTVLILLAWGAVFQALFGWLSHS